MNSDAVCHEESEYVIGFKIRATYDELSSIFRKKCKKAKKKYSTRIFMKIGSNSGKFITQIIIGKNFINSESLMDWDAVGECAK